MFIKQCKGKQLDKLPKSKMPYNDKMYYLSKKLDGFYVQIHINHVTKKVQFYTSGAKEFYLSDIAEQLLIATAPTRMPSLVVEAEYLYHSTGKLGSRANSAKLTTYRTDFEKNIKSKGSKLDSFNIFNIIDDVNDFSERAFYMEQIVEQPNVKALEQVYIEFSTAVFRVKGWVDKGWEGGMLNDPDVYYQPGKRVNDVIKLKYRPELIALVLEELEGTGRLEGTIGALHCTLENGVTFKVGSGFDDYMRAQWGAFIGHHVEVEFESYSADGVPLQPTLKRRVGDD